MSKKLKKSDFIKFSDNSKLNHSIIKMLKFSWTEIIEDPELIDEKNLSEGEIESLACMHINLVAEKALLAEEKSKRPLRFVVGKILEEVKIELKSLIRV